MIDVPYKLFKNKENAMLYDDFMETDKEEDLIALNEDEFKYSEIEFAIEVATILKEPDVVEFLKQL